MCNRTVWLGYHRESRIVQLPWDDVGWEGGERGGVSVDPFPRVVYSCAQIFTALSTCLDGAFMPWFLRVDGLPMQSAVKNIAPSPAESGFRGVCVNRQVPPTEFSLYVGGVSTALDEMYGC